MLTLSGRWWLPPEVHPNRSRQLRTGLTMTGRWPGCGGDNDDAVLAFRRVETISPVHLHRNPPARDALAKLVA